MSTHACGGTVDALIPWLSDTGLAHFMLDDPWAWPWAEALHFIGMAMLFGSVMLMDLRLLGVLRAHISIRAVHALTPWALAGFALNLLTGIAFFVTDPARYLANVSYRFKMIMIFLAGLNFLVFWFKIRKDSLGWRVDESASLSAKLVAATSLLSWTLVIWGGRMIPVYGVG